MTTLSVHDFAALSRTQRPQTQPPGELLSIPGVSAHLDRSRKPAAPPREQQIVPRAVLPNPPTCELAATLNAELGRILDGT
jgi:hypothetical protein